MITKPTKGLLYYLLHIVIGVGNDIILKKYSLNIPFLQIVFLRVLFGFLSLLIFLILFKSKVIKLQRFNLYIFRGMLLGLSLLLWGYSLTRIPISQVTAVGFSVPLFVLFLAPIILKEKVPVKIWLVTAICIISIFVTLNPFVPKLHFDLIYVLLASFLIAIIDIITKMYVNKENKLTVILYSAFFASIFLLIPVSFIWKSLKIYEYIVLLVLGISGNILVYSLHKALDYIKVSMLAPYRFIEFVFSTFLGYILFNEVPKLSTIVIGSLIICMNIYIYKTTQNNK